MLTIKKGTLKISEQTVKELMMAIEEAKNAITFTDKPMPDGDMNLNTYHQLRQERGEILVSSEYASLDFLISLETGSNSQESSGYKFKVERSGL